MMHFLLLLLPTIVFHFSLQTYAIILSKRMKVLISWWERVCKLVSFAVRVWFAYSLTGNIAFVRKTRRNKCSTCWWAIIKEIGARSPVPASRGAKERERRRKRGFTTTPSTLFVVWNNAFESIPTVVETLESRAKQWRGFIPEFASVASWTDVQDKARILIPGNGNWQNVELRRRSGSTALLLLSDANFEANVSAAI